MKREELLEKRRAGFTSWAISNGVDIFITRDMEYTDERTECLWLAWNAALDSVEIELPCSIEVQDSCDYKRETIGSLEAYGIKVKL